MAETAHPISHLFLDFDGVLRRNSAPPAKLEAECVANLQIALGPFPDLSIVISSVWRTTCSLDELRSLFPPRIAETIEGVTPQIDSGVAFTRFAEIHMYCVRKGIAEDSWIAVDDDPEFFPPGAPVLLTLSSEGFDSHCITRFWNMMGVE